MGLGAVSYSLFIVIMALSGIICEIKQDIGKKIVIFSYPLAFDAPVWGSPLEYCHPGKTRMAGLPDGEKILRICITVYTQYRRVTDRETDRHLATA